MVYGLFPQLNYQRVNKPWDFSPESPDSHLCERGPHPGARQARRPVWNPPVVRWWKNSRKNADKNMIHEPLRSHLPSTYWEFHEFFRSGLITKQWDSIKSTILTKKWEGFSLQLLGWSNSSSYFFGSRNVFSMKLPQPKWSIFGSILNHLGDPQFAESP